VRAQAKRRERDNETLDGEGEARFDVRDGGTSGRNRRAALSHVQNTADEWAAKAGRRLAGDQVDSSAYIGRNAKKRRRFHAQRLWNKAEDDGII
jgi:hypothetical protein